MVDLDLADQRVLIRVDLNVPVTDGRVTSDARLRASLPTIEQALKAGARVMLMSHLGRPEEGRFDAKYSLQPIADGLSQLLGRAVRLVKDWLDLSLIHISEPTRRTPISYAVFCLKKKKKH